MRTNQCFLLVLLCLCSLAAAPWTVTTADFEKRQAGLRSIDAQGLIVQAAGSPDTLRVPLEQFLSLSRNDAPPPAQTKPAFTLHVAGGQRLIGSPSGMTGETLAWTSDAIGQVPVGVRSIAGMTRGATPLPHSAELPTSDRVRLANGDVIEGVVADISGDGVAMTVGGQIVPVPLDSIVSVVFAGGGQQPSSERGFLVRLNDGSMLGGPTMTADSQSLTLSVAGEARTLPLASVRAIDQVNGPVAWVSDMQPVEDQQTPFIGQPVLTRFNTTLEGKALTVGERRFAKGIATHARSVLTWELPMGYSSFRTQYAIEGDRPQANVVVRVKLDGRLVHEQADVMAGQLYPVVTLPLQDAKRLTLEVDYGQTYDVQDRLLWIEPALVR